MRNSMLLFILVLGVLSEVEGTSEGRDEAVPGPVHSTDQVSVRNDTTRGSFDGDDEVKKDREALLRSSKILPFSTDPFLRPLGGLPGPFGVSLGLGLPVHNPLPFEIHPPPPPHPGRPVLVSNHRPECAVDVNYCLYNELYPLDKVNSIIDRYYSDVRHLYTDLYQFPEHDLIYYDNRTHSYRHGGHFVCESTVQYLRPGWAQNLHGEWVAVINTDKFPQSIRIESCRYKDKRCEYLPPCYKSRCVQRYSYVKLLCLDPYRPSYRPTVDIFQIPSACSCFVENFTYY